MIKRSVSSVVGKFGKVNVVENVGKFQMHQIVSNSGCAVDWPFVADDCRMRFGSGRPHCGRRSQRKATADSGRPQDPVER